MARPRDSRSPSPAGSHAARRRKDDDRRDRDRDRDRDHRRRSRSPDRRYRDRERDRGRDARDRDRDRDRDSYRWRDRSLDRRDDDYYRGSRRDGGGPTNRDRRRSRDRGPERPRSPDRRGPRGGDGNRDYRARRDDSRDRRDRRDGSADSAARRSDAGRPRPVKADGPAAKDNEGPQPAKSTPTQTQTEVDKKAERLRKLQAMKEKHAQKEAKEATVTAGSTRMLLAEMDQKASGASPGPNSPAAASAASPAPASPATPTPYAGKFDPKAIAKSSKGARAQSPARLGEVKLASLGTKPLLGGGLKQPGTKAAGLLPANRAVSAFGFGKSADSQKSSAKRKVDMDDEEIIKRKLVKLPDFVPENIDNTPDAEAEGDEDAEDDLDVLMARNEEDMAEAHRVLQERRDERIQKEEMAMDVDVDTEAAPNGAVATSETPQVTAMEVDDDVDPLDAFMADLEQVGPVAGFGSRPTPPGGKGAKKAFEPEAYFDDDDYGYEAEGADPSAILAIANKKKKKDIPTIDYSKLELNTIRKNFWVEPQELSQMTDEEAAELRLELDGIKVSGKNVPKPVQKWSQCGLTRPILDVIDTLGYEKPTSIQMQALPVIMSGRDVIGVAKTGSGKTMAFVLPMLRHIKDQDPVTGDDGAIALIMTPTRELCTQIYSDLLPFAKALKLRAIAAYGGNAIKDQIAELKRGAEIIVATPGRLIDLLAANSGRVTNLKRATYLVLDEADRMFDMGFEPQVMKIFNNVRPDRQTILFSATMPRIIDALTKKVLREPVEITVGGRSVVAAEITQVVEIIEENKKFVRLLELLGELYADDDDVRALIFVERQEKADDLLREVLRRGYGCMSIHGGKDQEDRNSTISDFKKGVCPIMIATSVAARGLDVKQLKLVVNYDAPNHLEDYVHRAGRTGRAGNTGTAVTFVTEEQENCAPGIAKALEQSGQPVPEQLNEMRKAWREKVKAGKAKDASGFGGKGLERLDKEREAARIRERKTHKAEGDDDDDKEEETAEDKEKKDKAKSAIEAAASAIVSRESAKAAAADGNTGSGTVSAGDVKPSPSGVDATGGAGSSSAVAGAASAVTAGKAGGALDKAASAISEINARLARAGHLRPGQPIDNKGPDAGAFHATLEINDFPQKARWAVTNRTNVAKILEATGTSITTKGNYYAPGKEPPSGADPKLYILIEGDTELVVGKALSELTRLLREGTIAAADAESRAPASGRYTIT